ncbi:LLM class F420-dependent oxidoreductase [Pseudonocardia acaciae]|uniref:LLM class F420-dependent oxidoreductase n=1 Tax=Pseudonocardia acaciae TaxID=551276 RepID=UPI00048B9F0A|nr:LLM class F420-dependent oxidoreductase [Pseudonocardia acaciae]
MSLVGVTLPIPGLPLRQHRDAVERLAEAGIGEVSTGESNGYDGLTPLVLASSWRPDLTLSVSVLSAFTRGPSIMASTAAALAEVAPGRARFGIGAGSDRIVQGWNGIPFERPYSRVAHTLRVLRATLSGQRASAAGDSAAALGVEDFKLAMPPRRPPALVVAALGPRMQRLAAAEADGVALNFLAATDMPRVRAAADGVERALPEPLSVQARVFVVPGEGDGAALSARRMIAAYLTVPVYANFQSWLGRGELLAEMQAAWERGDRAKAVEVIPDEVVSDLFLIGSPSTCARRVRAYLDAGVEIATLAMVPPHGAAFTPSDQVDFLCELATHV